MEPIQKGKQTNKTSNTCAGDKGKQTNKQTSGGSTCGGTDAGGGVELCNMRSPIHNVSEYAEELWRCIGDVSEKHGVQYTGLYSDSELNLCVGSLVTEAYGKLDNVSELSQSYIRDRWRLCIKHREFFQNDNGKKARK